MFATNHAFSRLSDRLSTVLDNKTISNIHAKAQTLASKCFRDTAIRVHVLNKRVGTPWSDTSNGDVVVAIVRGGKVVTYMFRRFTQPHTPEAYRVSDVLG